MKQYLNLTKMLRYAVQQGLIKYNHAIDLKGIVGPGITRHPPALPLQRPPNLLDNIGHYKGQPLSPNTGYPPKHVWLWKA